MNRRSQTLLAALATVAGFVTGTVGTLYVVEALFANPFEPTNGWLPVRPDTEARSDVDRGPDAVFERDAPDTLSLLRVEAMRSPSLPPDSADTLIEALRRRRLIVPVQGVGRADLVDHFDDTRGTDRRHQAIDIQAPRGTPVVAADDGRIAKLYLSNRGGGIALYQFDPTETFGYYYAHLERYAEGLSEDDRVRKGDVIGHVGTTGNAPPDTPHLHFAITLLTPEKRWWEGVPLNPYRALR